MFLFEDKSDFVAQRSIVPCKSTCDLQLRSETVQRNFLDISEFNNKKTDVEIL